MTVVTADPHCECPHADFPEGLLADAIFVIVEVDKWGLRIGKAGNQEIGKSGKQEILMSSFRIS